MNFNYNNTPEYGLISGLTDELINLYGFQAKFVLTKKINKDTIFKDFSHVKTSDYKMIMVAPENTDTLDQGDYDYNEFGFNSFATANFFVMASQFDGVCELKDIVSHLLVFPNKKVFEITHTDVNNVFTMSNLFPYPDDKVLIKLICKPYSFDINDEGVSDLTGDTSDILDVVDDYNALDKYFKEIIKDQNAVVEDIEVNPVRDTIKDTDKKDEFDLPKQEIEKKPLIVNDEKDVFGSFS